MATGPRVLAQDPGCQVIPIVEGKHVTRAYAQPVEEDCQEGWARGPQDGLGDRCPQSSGGSLAKPSGHSHSDVQHDALVFLHMHAPDAVLPTAVGLWPVGGEHHAGRVCDLPTAHSWKAEEAHPLRVPPSAMSWSCHRPTGVPTHCLEAPTSSSGGSLNHTCQRAPVVPGPVAGSLVPTLLPALAGPSTGVY